MTYTIKRRSTDTLWYLLLPIMERFHIEVTRHWFKTLIKQICDKACVKRSEIGVITGARAELYFNGRWESVSLDAIEELAGKGTDVVFIEKEGIIDELTGYADKYGVAFVNSRGYLTEYAQDLMKAAEKSRANVAIMTDYDLSGINLASKCPKTTHYITMDDSTLQYFHLEKDSSIVVRATNTKLVDHVEDIIRADKRFKDVDIEFLRTKRIEINAIIAKVGDERFWNFIMDKLNERYPIRDYNRAMEPPSKDPDMDEIDIYPNPIRKLIQRIRGSRDDAVADIEARIESDQQKVKGFLTISEQKKKNKDRVMKAIAENEDFKKLEGLVAELCQSLGIDLSDDGGKEGASR
jgi:hypothetical protein